MVFTLDLTEEEAIKRITSRKICKNCGAIYNLQTNPPKQEGVCDVCGHELIQREDDNEEDIKIRFENYYANTKKLTDYLSEKGKLTRIDGNRPINEIFEEISSKLTTYVQ